MALHDRILLATDLSARSDRALDRAVTLMRRIGSELVVLHVIEPTPGNRYYPRTQPVGTLAAIARTQLAHDLGDCADKATIRIEEGDPAEVIERVAREQASTLIVVGVARVERLGRFTLGTTVEKLVRGVEAPLLIVTDRPRAPYQKVAVAADFSPVSGQALALATDLFPQQRITVFHAYQPLATYAASNVDAHNEQFRRVAQANYAGWLANLDLAAGARERVVPKIELGDPPRLLREAAEHGAFDLLVIGTRGRGRIFEFFLGSVAKRILAELPCDALFVRESQLPALAEPPAPSAN